MTGYEQIRAMAKATNCSHKNLLVLADQNDPFYTGTPTELQMAEWFTNIWNQMGVTYGVHTRRIHYWLVSQPNPKDYNGKPYENTETCWNHLENASKYARALRLVDPALFDDRRNPDPHIFQADVQEMVKPTWEYYFPEWCMPEINTDLTYDTDLQLPNYHVLGYDQHDTLQPYHVELWCEKSTMDDILVPLCQQHRVNLITGIGFLSITSVISLLQRVAEIGKPSRILYISDFDPAGNKMPRSIARQIEYWIGDFAPGADIKLEQVILTAEQVRQYDLPRIFIKDSDRRKANFEAIYGMGAVELDALEALYQGEFRRLVNKAILQFRDSQLSIKLARARNDAQDALAEEFDDHLGPYQNDIDELQEDITTVVQKYQAQLQEMNDQLQDELEPYRQRAEALRQAITDRLDYIEPELPDLPEPNKVDEGNDWLFDSNRTYLDQLAVYKRRQVNGNE